MDQLSSSAIAAMSAKRWRVSALVKGFGCRPHAGGAACAVGRRPKASVASHSLAAAPWHLGQCRLRQEL